jgi:hypothetical protein
MKTLPALRFLVCCAVALCAALTGFAQTRAGAVKAVRVTGDVARLDAAGVRTPVAEGQALIETDTIVTGDGAGVVLVFMNGSSVKLAGNSRLAIEEFKMDPLAENIAIANLKNEPSVSKTRLSLAYGEMVGNVKTLHRSSTYDVKTPVGAAGIRGTTFRILLRFEANGQVAFQLSTAEGRVLFEGTTQLAGTGTTTEMGTTQAVEVAEGLEVSAVAEVNTATGTVTSVQVTAVQPISASATQAITTAITQAIEQAAQATTFTPVEQQQAAQQTPPSGTTPAQQSDTPSQENKPESTPPTVLDSSTRSGSG